MTFGRQREPPVAGESVRRDPLPPRGVPLLHAIASDEVVAGSEFARLAGEMFTACGCGLALHLRLRESSARRLQELATDLTARAAEAGGWCVVNARLDVARVAGAQAVQLGRGALGVREARGLLSPDAAIGASVHDEREAEARAREGANFLVAGTVFPSQSHPGRPAAGVSLISRCSKAGLPVVAIGGITRARVPEVVKAGAAGVAVIRALWSSRDPVAEARRLVEAIRAAAVAATGK